MLGGGCSDSMQSLSQTDLVYRVGTTLYHAGIQICCTILLVDHAGRGLNYYPGTLAGIYSFMGALGGVGGNIYFGYIGTGIPLPYAYMGLATIYFTAFLMLVSVVREPAATSSKVPTSPKRSGERGGKGDWYDAFLGPFVASLRSLEYASHHLVVKATR